MPTGILTPEIRSYLGIDDTQASKIKNRAIKIRDELKKKIAELTKKAQDDLLAEFSEPQKKKYRGSLAISFNRKQCRAAMQNSEPFTAAFDDGAAEGDGLLKLLAEIFPELVQRYSEFSTPNELQAIFDYLVKRSGRYALSLIHISEPTRPY